MCGSKNQQQRGMGLKCSDLLEEPARANDSSPSSPLHKSVQVPGVHAMMVQLDPRWLEVALVQMRPVALEATTLQGFDTCATRDKPGMWLSLRRSLTAGLRM